MGVFFATGVTVTSNTWQRFADVWDGLVDNACAALVAQTSASGLLSLVTQNETTGAWDFSVVSQLFASWVQIDDKAACESLTGFLRATQLTGALTQADVDGMKSVVVGTSSRAWMVFANHDVRMMTESQALSSPSTIAVFAEGGDGGENVSSMPALMSFTGGDGDDVIAGNGGEKWVAGGLGNDTVSNVKCYVYGRGDGHDVVSLCGNGAASVVLVGITEAELRVDGALTQQGADLVFRLSESDSVVFKNWFASGVQNYTSTRLWCGTFVLENDGVQTSLSMSEIDAIGSTVWGTPGADTLTAFTSVSTVLHGGDGNDTITGSGRVDTIYGDDGNDTLYGGGGADILNGGAGDDSITGDTYYRDIATAIGGAGNDTITNCGTVIFRPGDGHDTVTMVTGGKLVLEGFAAGALEQPNVVQQQDVDLVINLGTDSVRLAGWFQKLGTAYESRQGLGATVKFVDDAGVVTVYPREPIIALSAIIFGTDAADTIGVRCDAPSIIHGGAGNDILTGSWYADKLYGDDGNDVLNGNSSGDLLDGGAGNDIITDSSVFGSGATAIGGLGDDTVSGCTNVVFRPGDGHDTVTMVSGGTLKLMGYAVDALAGGQSARQSGDDLILALGADTVTLKSWFTKSGTARYSAGSIVLDDLAGNTVTLTTAQVDALSAIVNGTAGADTITMRTDLAATVHGGAGNDVITGSYSADSLFGEDGDDTLRGNGGTDVLDGGAGNDTLWGGSSTGSGETAIGGAGNDSVYYSTNVVFRPGDGADTVYMVRNGVLKLIGYAVDALNGSNVVRQSGDDLVVALGSDTVTLKGWFTKSSNIRYSAGSILLDDLAGNTVTLTTAQVDALSAIVNGTSGADTISMSQNISATVHGGAGNDVITGSTLADSLFGEDGADTIRGNGGVDLLDGGAGNDILWGGVSTGSGETAIGGAGNDTIYYSTNVVFRPGDGNDTVYMVKDGVLKLMGYAVDALSGGQSVRQSGDDLVLVLGADTVTLKGWFTKSSNIRYSAGSIVLDDLAGNTMTLTTAQVDALSAIVNGTSGADTIAMSQNIAATVHGGAGNDVITGSTLADSLFGEDGNDTLIGNYGADLLDGGAGDDTIVGTGASYGQTAIGGAGNDTISAVATVKYALGDGNDTVTFSSSSTLRLYGATHQSLVFTRVGTYDLKMTMPDAGSILFKNFYNGTSYRPSSVVFYDTTDMATAVQVASWTPTDLLAAATQGTGYGFAGSDAIIAATLESGTSIVAGQALAAGDADGVEDANEAIAGASALAAGDQAAPGASAVVLNGGRQADNDVTWCLAGTSRDTTGLFSSQMGTEMEALVRAACEAWEQVCGVHFTQVADNGLADLRFGFGDFDSATTGVIGYANMKQNADGTFAKDSVLRIDDTADVAAVTNENGELVYQGMNASVQQVLEHEIGHALGLASDADQNSVMCWKLTDQTRGLNATDVAGAQMLYGAPTSTTASIQNAANQLIQAMSQAEPAAQTGQNPLTGEPNSQPLMLAVSKVA